MHTGEVGTLGKNAEEWFLFCSLAKSYLPNRWLAKLLGGGGVTICTEHRDPLGGKHKSGSPAVSCLDSVLIMFQ